MKQSYIGIDTGDPSGAIFLDIPGREKRFWTGTEAIIIVIEISRALGYEPHITIEKHNALMKIVKCYGAYKETLGICKGMKVLTILEVSPRTWQSFFGFQMSNTKAQSLKTAKQIFPGVKFDNLHDVSDAALICEHGKRNFLTLMDKAK